MPEGDTREDTPATILSTQILSRKYVYRTLPTFDPVYYQRWTRQVRQAFHERKWTAYLDYPKPDETRDPEIENQAISLLDQSIPNQYGGVITRCNTAADIWAALQEHYAKRSIEDLMRLKNQLSSTRKTANETIDQYIDRFNNLINAIMAQQTPTQQFETAEINSTFIYSLETSDIPNEDWKPFAANIGKSWLTSTTHGVYSDARTYYNLHIARPSNQQLQTPALIPAIETRALLTRSYNERYCNKCKRQGHTEDRCYPRDPNGFCTVCDRKGHRTDQCMRKETESNEAENSRKAITYPSYSEPTTRGARRPH